MTMSIANHPTTADHSSAIDRATDSDNPTFADVNAGKLSQFTDMINVDVATLSWLQPGPSLSLGGGPIFFEPHIG
jgi:hypothetical protein